MEIPYKITKVLMKTKIIIKINTINGFNHKVMRKSFGINLTQ